MLLTPKQKDEMAEKNYALIFYVAKSFINSGIPYDELESIAIVGYAKALNAFDLDREVKFSTYAINCIKNEILYFLRRERVVLSNSVSLNKILSVDKNGNNLSIEDTVSNINIQAPNIEDEIILNDDMEILRKGVQHLSEKEAYIITYRYGLDRGIIKTQKEIARDVHMSQANISKLEKNILDKIRRILKDKIDY